MKDNIFRFVNVRPPQRKEPLEGTIDYIDPYRAGRTDFWNRLVQALKIGGRQGASSEAVAYIRENGIVSSLTDLQTPLAAFDQVVIALGPDASVDSVSEAVWRVFDSELQDVVTQKGFQKDRRKLADSITAAFFLGVSPIPSLAHLVRGLRLCELVERIVDQDEDVVAQGGVARALQAIISIPFDLSLAAGAGPLTHWETHWDRVSWSASHVEPAGVSDLLIVRQTLRRYERGEIAHVENALKGEFKERTHRRTQTTETLLLQEVETTTEQERDLQSTERFELKSEASKTVQEDMQVQAGLTVTGTYGAVTATATGQFGFERSVEEATRTASSYARDVVERTRERVQERTLERRMLRTVLEVEETAKHGLDNTKEEADHIVGIYRWIDKIYEAQIVNYGKRLMLDFYVPEPAAYYRVIEPSYRLKGLTREKPEKPVVPRIDGSLRDLRPEDVKWPAVQGIAAKYAASGIQPPPPETVTIGTSIEVPHTDKDYEKAAPILQDSWLPALGGTKVNSEIKIPEGYTAIEANWSGHHQRYVRTYVEQPPKASHSNFLEAYTSVSVGSKSITKETTGFKKATDEITGTAGDKDLADFTDRLPIAVLTSAASMVVTFRVICKRTDERFHEWQVQTYDAIMAAYRAQLQEYEEEVARVNTERGIQISGRPPAENRKIEQTELKRAAISILTRQYFDTFNGFDDTQPEEESKSTRIAFDKTVTIGASTAAERDFVQYFEQAFEWHNITYLFYPYFWGRKSQWPEVLGQESTDPLFAQFLRAGYARVQVPVRPNYETMVLYFLTSGAIWQEAEDAPVAKPYLPLVDEIRNQTGDDFTIGAGTVDVQKGKTRVTGKGTRFTKDDVDREIRIAAKVYRISSWQSATAITLAKPFKGEDKDGTNAAYSLGPKLVGPPWEVRLPTTLVMIDKPDFVLPSCPDD
jgi:hypothetical protein